MPRDFKVYLDDILLAIAKIQKFTKKFNFKKFSSDEKTFDAVVRNLEVIGEAIKKIPPGLKSDYPDIEWRKIAGLRDILIHEYFGVDTEIIWDIVKNKLPDLKKQVNKILKSNG
jgi:uncharacterized protein with HEPN domain